MGLIMYVYDLTDNVTGQVIYVGQTYQPKQRFQVHRSMRKPCDISMNILEELHTGDWTVLTLANNMEQYWIEQMETWGFKLENKYNNKRKLCQKKRI